MVFAAVVWSAAAQPTSPPCATIPPGLVSWWRAETNLIDGWDSNDGSAIQGPPFGIPNVAYTAGKVGQAFSLYTNGVLIADNVSLRPTNALSIEGWVNPSNFVSSALRTILAKFPSPNIPQTNSSYYLGISNGKLLFKVSGNGSAVTTAITPQTLPLGQWSHVAATYDGALLRLYTNGALAAQTNFTGAIFSETLDVGIGAVPYQRSAWYLPWTGQLDEISVYSRALTDSEIAVIYNADLSGKCLSLPIITVQPQSQAVPLNEDVLFSPTAVGSKPLRYQWQFNGTNLAGATATTLLREKVQSNFVGNYSFVVTNALGRATSSAAALTLLPPLSCITAPTGMLAWWPANNFSNDVVSSNNATLSPPTPLGGFSGYTTGKVAQCFNFSNGYASVPSSPQVNFGSNADFSIEAWLKYVPANSPLGGASSEQLFIVQKIFQSRIAPPIPPSTAVGYSMLLQDGRLACQLTMAPFTSDNIPTFVSPGPDLRDGMFHHVALAVDRDASDGGHLYVDGQNVLTFDARAVRGSLSNSAALTIGDDLISGFRFSPGPIERIDELTFYNRALSAAEVLAIRLAGSAGKCVPRPNILLSPTNQTITIGSPATLRVLASGFPTLLYQWTKNGTNLPGATSNPLVIASPTFSDAGQYAVTVSNSGGSITSAVATVSINQPPLASNITAGTKQNKPISIPIAKMLFYASDPDGDPLTLSAVTTSTNGASVITNINEVIYTPASDYIGSDAFSWGVSDGRGGSASALVLIEVRPYDQVSGNMLPLTVVPGGYQVGFFGIPGRTYTLQRAESVSGPWTTLTSVLAGPDGLGLYYDTNSPPTTAFYRTVYP